MLFCRSLPATTATRLPLFPSPVLLPTVTAACNASNVAVGAQNIHFAEEGAYTGETSVGQLLAVGGTHTLIGHSERRQYFAETDEIVNKKLHTALKHSVIPIVCVGEVLAEREANLTADVLKTQITGAFAGITAEAAAPIVIAYEPVWAIGTGKTATPEMAAEAHKIIRAEVAKVLGADVAAAMRILYGGSVKPDNATALIGQEEIDGALVGGASLKPDSFAAIVKY
jgi:triosephosphate isomerase